MRIFFDIDCGEAVYADDIKQLLDKTADYLTSDQDCIVESVTDHGILDIQFH